MKLYLLIPLFSLVFSQQCVPGKNCPFNQGFCNGGTCECLEGYKTFYNKALPFDQQTYCNYQQINHFIPLILEIVPGLGHFYVGKYIQGAIKLILFVSWLSSALYLKKELQIPGFVKSYVEVLCNRALDLLPRGGNNGFSMADIAQHTFNITNLAFWVLFCYDIYMYFTKSYRDGNGIPLI